MTQIGQLLDAQGRRMIEASGRRRVVPCVRCGECPDDDGLPFLDVTFANVLPATELNVCRDGGTAGYKWIVAPSLDINAKWKLAKTLAYPCTWLLQSAVAGGTVRAYPNPACTGAYQDHELHVLGIAAAIGAGGALGVLAELSVDGSATPYAVYFQRLGWAKTVANCFPRSCAACNELTAPGADGLGPYAGYGGDCLVEASACE